MTVEIRETCPCGAEFYVRDTVVFGNTASDRYDDFLEAHEDCRKIRKEEDEKDKE